MKIKLIPFILCIMFFSACASTAKYEEILDSWVNNNVNDLVRSWGYPKNSFKAPNGNRVYVYEWSSSYTSPTYTNTTHNLVGDTIQSNSLTTGGLTTHYWCRTFFEVGFNDRIITWRWEGNDCKSRKMKTTE